jgi:hypothetical protein
MPKRKGPPQFANPRLIRAPQACASCFDQQVAALRLSPEQYAGSRELRNWVSRNRRHRYIPSEVLATFGFEVVPEI